MINLTESEIVLLQSLVCNGAKLSADAEAKLANEFSKIVRLTPNLGFYHNTSGSWCWLINDDNVERSIAMDTSMEQAWQLHAIYCKCFDNIMGTVTIPYYDPQRSGTALKCHA
jgi:hypothetical protein